MVSDFMKFKVLVFYFKFSHFELVLFNYSMDDGFIFYFYLRLWMVGFVLLRTVPLGSMVMLSLRFGV